MTALRIGTRGSPLALAQARETRDRLAAQFPELAEPGATEIVPIRTTGDRLAHSALGEPGGKGLFVKEIEEALLDRAIDVAVHSMKDVPIRLPPGLTIAAVLPREDPREALLANGAAGIAGLPFRALVGTSSARRRAQLLHRRPDLKFTALRGNVDTRLRKIAAGEAAATVLAVAGLNRLGAAGSFAVLGIDEMLPALCQGAIGLECREDDHRTRRLVAAISDPPTATCIAAERAVLLAVDGSCALPLAGLAQLDAGNVSVRGAVLRPDGTHPITAERVGPAISASALGQAVGDELRNRAGPKYFEI
jgi:hydroxymethylbilane synthase